MSDQSKLALLSDSPTGDTVRTAGAVRSFALGGPTEAQKKAGNYRKLHTSVHGLNLSIENAKGDLRTGKDKGGKHWTVVMPAHYGYIKGTEGADGDHVDIYLGPHPHIAYVHVVDQVDHETGAFDEHKALMGFPSKKAALDAYRAGFSDGKGADRIGGTTTLAIDKFKEWLARGVRKRPLSKLAPPKPAAQVVKSFAEGGAVEGDQEDGPWNEYQAPTPSDEGGEEAGPWDDYKKPEKSSTLGAFGRGLAEGALPAAAALPAAGAGAEIGGALGALGGPAAPATVPLGMIAGGIGGAYLGAKGMGEIQDWFLDKLGLLDKDQRAADEEEHPYARMAGNLAPNLAAFNPGKIASSLASRLVPGAIGAGTEAAQEKLAGQDIDTGKLAIAAGGMALLNRPTKLGGALLGAGERGGANAVGRLPAATQEAIQAGKQRSGEYWGGKATEGQPGRPDLAPETELSPPTETPDAGMTPDFQNGETWDQGTQYQDQHTMADIPEGGADEALGTVGHGYPDDMNFRMQQENQGGTEPMQGAPSAPAGYKIGGVGRRKPANENVANPGTAPVDNAAVPAETAAPAKTPESIAQDKSEASPARNNAGTVGTAHEQAPPSTTLETIGSNPDHPIGVGSENVYGKSKTNRAPPNAEILDPTKGGIPSDVAAAMGGDTPKAPEPTPAPQQQGRPPIGPEQPPIPNTGIQQGAVTDTVTKLRNIGADRVADAVEKNPHVEPQARRILQDLTASQQEHGMVDAAKAQRARRMMERANSPDERAAAEALMEEAKNPQAEEQRAVAATEASKTNDARREAAGQKVKVGDETVTAASQRKAALIKRAADASQAAFDKFPQREAPHTKESGYQPLSDRLTAALAHATEENLGVNPVKRGSAKDTPAQAWLREAQNLVGTPDNPKQISPAGALKFLGNERMLRSGVKGAAKDVADLNKVEGDVKFNKRRVTADPIDKAISDWESTLSPEDRASWKQDDHYSQEADAMAARAEDDFVPDYVPGKRPGLDDYDGMIDKASEFFGNEDGAVNIPKLIRSFHGLFGQQARRTALSYIARTPTSARQEYARSLSDGLQIVRQQKIEQRVQLLKQEAAMPAAFKTEAVQKQVYEAHEKGTTNSLPTAVKAAYDQYLKPIFDQNDTMFQGIETLDPGNLGPKIQNHIYRIAKGLHPEYGGDPISGTMPIRGLSKTASMLKNRQFLAIEDAQGNRKVVSPTEAGYSEWNNGVATHRPNGNFEAEAGKTFTDYNGQQQTVKTALTPEIEQHGLFANGKPAQYYHNAIVSAVETNAYLGDVLRHLQYLESVKADPTFLKYATTDPKLARDNDWKTTILPQMKNKWYMANQLRYAFDDFAKPGLDAEALDHVRNFSQQVTKLLFWMPTAHIGNVGAHWFVARGWDWIKPEGWKNLAVTTTQAIKSVLEQDATQTALRGAGAGTVYGGVITNDFLHRAATAAGMAMVKNHSQWDPIAKVLGVSVPDLARSIYSWSSRTMWSANDMMLTQAVMENQRKGMNLKDAISRAEQHIPNYRIPTTIMGSGEGARFFSKLMQDPLFMAFGRYHYGVFNSYAHIVKDIAQGTGEQRMESIGKLMAMGVLAYAVYPVLNQMAGIVTGNKDATMHPRGPIAIPHHIVRALQGKEDIMQGARSTLTLSPLLATSMETLQNRDWAGRSIVEPGDVHKMGSAPTVGGKLRAAGRVAVQSGEHLARGLVSPYGAVAQAADAGRSLPGTVRDQALDIRNPSPASVKYEHTGPIKNDTAARNREKKGRGPAERIYNRLTN